MAEEYTECLLKNEFHENCPGCKVDQMKRLHQGFPFSELCSIWIIVLCSSLPISSLFPFLYFMIGDLNISKKEEDIGFYAGFVVATCTKQPSYFVISFIVGGFTLTEFISIIFFF